MAGGVKIKKARNWHAVNAHFRRSGVMGDKSPKKAESANKCRKFNQRDYQKEE